MKWYIQDGARIGVVTLGTKTNGYLGLNVFADGNSGWGVATNKNMKTIDGSISLLQAMAQKRATDIEKSVAAHSADILSLVQEGGADFASKAEALKAAITIELKEYIDTLIDSHINRSLANQTSVVDSITTAQTQLGELEDQINTYFTGIESSINTRFNDVNDDLTDRYNSVVVMRDQLLGLLNALALKLDAHINNRENPHRVTFAQAGGGGAVKYKASANDGRYL